MAELRKLYQEIVLDHGRKPRNFGAMENADHEAHGENRVCGDRVTVFVKATPDRIENIRFEGSGCLISMASASMMTQAITGKSMEESAAILHRFGDLLTGKSKPGSDSSLPGDLRALAGVRDFPIRIKCATLPWRTLQAALERRRETVTTE